MSILPPDMTWYEPDAWALAMGVAAIGAAAIGGAVMGLTALGRRLRKWWA